MLCYSLASEEAKDGAMGDEDTQETPKQWLMGWVQEKIPELPQPISNFTKDWNDGRAVGALVDACAPGQVWFHSKSENTFFIT